MPLADAPVTLNFGCDVETSMRTLMGLRSHVDEGKGLFTVGEHEVCGIFSYLLLVFSAIL